MMYQINDIVVYRRDVCRVVDTEESAATGEMCYVLEPYNAVSGGRRMLVPVANRGGHLRSLSTSEEIYDLIDRVPSLEMLENKPANMKSQYVALLKTDSLEDLIRIIKTSYYRNKERSDNRKKLATIDGEYQQKAEKYLFSEFAVALGKSYEECKEEFVHLVRNVESAS
ncbi:MAG: hypothetical protein E7190_13245 [Erysipelotrichaceae bacterium]|nr:hypothetical protein [Erysipelotrichaceae bacterium]